MSCKNCDIRVKIHENKKLKYKQDWAEFNHCMCQAITLFNNNKAETRKWLERSIKIIKEYEVL